MGVVFLVDGCCVSSGEDAGDGQIKHNGDIGVCRIGVCEGGRRGIAVELFRVRWKVGCCDGVGAGLVGIDHLVDR